MKLDMPIAIMSFDRPDYLRAVLQALLRQQWPSSVLPRFFLFQDAAQSARSNALMGDPERMLAAVRVFKHYFPDGVVVQAEHNLGIARNFDRAERAFFEDMKADVAVFLEDDMILSRYYFCAMAELAEAALKRPEIGMFSAYGQHHFTELVEQKRRIGEICLMNEHNWAFGITRACWAARDKVVAEYLDLIDDIDYRERGSRNAIIKAFQIRCGRGGRGYLSSQDSIKNMACEVSGFHRISTFANFARYIGRKGEHMNETKFALRGYDSTVVYASPPQGFHIPDGETLRLMRRTFTSDKFKVLFEGGKA
jgi:hypothetical protein